MNLKHKAIESDNWFDLAKQLDEIARLDIEVKYTQTKIGKDKFYAMVYYKDLEGKETQTKETYKVCQDCGKKISDKVAEFSMKKYKKHLCFKCQKVKE